MFQVSILNELYPGIQYQLLSTSGPSHAPNFIIKASLNEMSAEGSGKSKKDAKLNASKALLVLRELLLIITLGLFSWAQRDILNKMFIYQTPFKSRNSP